MWSAEDMISLAVEVRWLHGFMLGESNKRPAALGEGAFIERGGDVLLDMSKSMLSLCSSVSMLMLESTKKKALAQELSKIRSGE